MWAESHSPMAPKGWRGFNANEESRQGAILIPDLGITAHADCWGADRRAKG
jgi:hypothetical protein